MSKLTGLEFTLQFDRKVDIDERGSRSYQIQLRDLSNPFFYTDLLSPTFYLNQMSTTLKDGLVDGDNYEMSATSLDDPTKIRVILSFVEVPERDTIMPLIEKKDCKNASFKELQFCIDPHGFDFNILRISDLCFEVDYEKIRVSDKSPATVSMNENLEPLIDYFDTLGELYDGDDDFDKID